MVSDELARLQRTLGCAIQRRDILAQALTHRSAGGDHNERLELLGDALLGFVVAEALYRRFPEADEGQLSRMRATLVNRESLARIARERRLGDYLRLGAGELRTGGHARDSILADALEAVLAAVYLDQGLETARTVIHALYQEALDQPQPVGSSKDPKTRLQELLQAQHRPLPEYQVLAVKGNQHDQTFRVACTLTDHPESTEGAGTSRRRAEQAAAQRMLLQLGAEGAPR